MKGELNFVNERFVDVTVAALDNGVHRLQRESTRAFRNPQIEKEVSLSQLPIRIDPLEDALRFIQGKSARYFTRVP